MATAERLNLECTVQRNSEVIAAEAGQDIVMVNIASSSYYGVANVAREIWESIEQPKKILDIVDHLAATYKVDRSLCEEETLSFLEELLAEDLLKVRSRDEASS
jgi:hypothetical protein